MTEHVVNVIVLRHLGPGDDWYRALCATCDFKGPATPTRQVAGEQAEAHRIYATSAAKLTGRVR